MGVWDERGAEPRLAAGHSSYAFTLPVPGGARLPTAGLTWVSVHPGHRRRGLARAMVTAHLHRSAARGEVVSALYAAEMGIYGRYGYGVATRHLQMTLGRAAALREVPGSADLVVELEQASADRHADLVQRVHAAVDRPGWVTRDTEALRARRCSTGPRSGAAPSRCASPSSATPRASPAATPSSAGTPPGRPPTCPRAWSRSARRWPSTPRRPARCGAPSPTSTS